jgi:excisionase family DNA binding protein
MNTALSPPPLTIDEVAERWHYSADSVRRLIRAGALAASRIGPQRLLVLADDVAEYERYALAREPLTREVVYFAQAQRSKLIKIGSAQDAKQRIAGIQTGNSEPVRPRYCTLQTSRYR